MSSPHPTAIKMYKCLVRKIINFPGTCSKKGVSNAIHKGGKFARVISVAAPGSMAPISAQSLVERRHSCVFSSNFEGEVSPIGPTECSYTLSVRPNNSAVSTATRTPGFDSRQEQRSPSSAQRTDRLWAHTTSSTMDTVGCRPSTATPLTAA